MALDENNSVSFVSSFSTCMGATAAVWPAMHCPLTSGMHALQGFLTGIVTYSDGAVMMTVRHTMFVKSAPSVWQYSKSSNHLHRLSLICGSLQNSGCHAAFQSCFTASASW